MIRTIYYWIVFWLYQILILPSRWRCQRLTARGQTEVCRARAMRQAREWSGLLLALSGSRIERVGTDRIPTDRAVLFVSNHQGEFDIPLILSSVPRETGFIAKKELRKIPFVGFWMEAIDCLFLDRENRRQMLEVSKKAAVLLQEGHSLVVFPEGTRSNSDTVAEFKKGSLSLAERAGVDLVPVAIQNSHRMKKKKNLIIQKADVRITFLPPIHPADLSEGEKEKLHLTLHDRIQESAMPSAIERGEERPDPEDSASM